MLDTYLPITSLFNKKGMKENNSNIFHFNLQIDKELNLICLKKFKDNPSIKYRHKWLTCFEPEKHLDELSNYLTEKIIKKRNLNIFGFSFKDDSLIKRIKKSLNQEIFNIKTSKEIGLPINGACLFELFKFFIPENIKYLVAKNGKADLFIVRHTLEHSWNLKIFFQSLSLFLNKDAIVVFEVPDSERGLKSGMQTILWEEHASYFTKDSLINIFEFFGFKIIKFFQFKNEIEDSFVVIAKSTQYNKKLEKGLFSLNRELLKTFKQKFSSNKDKIKLKIKNIKSSGSKIFIFGGGHHASSFVSINELNNDISFVIDDNTYKNKYNLAGTNIPIMPSSFLKNKEMPIHLFLTTNPENNLHIKKLIKSLNEKIVVESIFDFY